jgi:iron complex outermembrane recepter protein
MLKSSAIRHAVRGVLLTSAFASYAPAFAADTDEAVNTVIVTGSRIARTEQETPSPVQVISRDEIEKTGKQNIAEVLRGIGADNQGSIPTSFSAGFATGAAAVSLRGLGVNSTLVLINGRRMAAYGLADDGARTFVDLNTIPLEAVERVEVLKDGASAIYGSDAVGGVVNIILKDTYQGAQLGATVGSSNADDGEVYRVNGSFGFGDPVTDRYNVYATVEASKNEAIKQVDRPQLGGFNLTGRGFFDNRRGARAAGLGEGLDGLPAFSTSTPYGSVARDNPQTVTRINLTACPEASPDTGMCLYDPLSFIEVQPKQERFNIFTRGSFKFTDSTEGYAELGWFHNHVQAIGTPGGVNDGGVFNPADPLNPVTAPHNPVIPASHPDNPTGENRTFRLLTTMFGGRNSTVNSDVLRAVVGVKGDITSDWTFDVGAGYVESNLYRAQTGLVYFPALQAGLNDGTFRVDPALDSPALLAAISPTLKDHDKNSLTLADATVSGKTFELPGGPLGVAVGIEWRREKSDTPPVPFTDTSDIVGLGYSAFSAERTVYAGYVELDAPILPELEANAAFRYDHYSDVGHSTTPKIGLKWTPIKQLAIRGTYSEAFRAPGPTESGNSSTLGFTSTAAIISQGDPSVKPETAKSYTGGIVFEPFRDTNIAIDYFKIDRKDEITPADQSAILGGGLTQLPSCTSGAAPPCYDLTNTTRLPGALPNSFLYYNELGALATISGPFSNLAKTTTDGLDIDAHQGFDIGGYGKIEIALLWTHVFSFEKTLPDGTKVEYVGTHGPYALSSASGTPEDRGSLEVSWSRNTFSLTGRVNYVGSMKMIDHKGSEVADQGDGYFSTDTGEGTYFFGAGSTGPTTACGVYNPNGSLPYGNCKIPYFMTFDLFGKLNISEQFELTASVTNFTNRTAPFDPYTYGALNYNAAFAQDGAVGRFFTVGAKYKFQ